MVEGWIQNSKEPENRPIGSGRAASSIAGTLIGLSVSALLIFLLFRFFAATQFVILVVLGALCLSATLSPLAGRIPGPCGLRAAIAVGLPALLIGALLFGLGWGLSEPIQENLARLPELRDSANEGLRRVGRRLGLDSELTLGDIAGIGAGLLTGGRGAGWVSDIAQGVLTTAVAAFIIMIGAVYLLARPARGISDAALKLLPQHRRTPTLRAFEELMPQLRFWLLGTLFSMAVVGLITGTGYWIIGLHYAIPLAALAGLAQVVPTFGPMLMGVVSLLVAATQGLSQVLGVLAVYVLVQVIESYFLTPLVMRKAVRIPPIVTMLTIVFWGNAIGAPGLILAIPLDLTIWSLLKKHVIEYRCPDGGRPVERARAP